MSKAYCGYSKTPPKGTHLGTLKECVQKGQLRRYGLKHAKQEDVDKIKLSKAEVNDYAKLRGKIIKELASARGTIGRYKGRYEKAPKSITEEEKQTYYKLWKDAEKKYNALLPRFNDIDAKYREAKKQNE